MSIVLELLEEEFNLCRVEVGQVALGVTAVVVTRKEAGLRFLELEVVKSW